MKKRYDIPEWVLSSKEESKLSVEEKQQYYQKLREYCVGRKLVNTTIGATIIGPKLKKLLILLLIKYAMFWQVVE